MGTISRLQGLLAGDVHQNALVFGMNVVYSDVVPTSVPLVAQLSAAVHTTYVTTIRIFNWDTAQLKPLNGEVACSLCISFWINKYTYRNV